VTTSRLRVVREAWLVLVLALVFGGLLAGVHLGLTDRIEANKRAETLGQIPALVLGSEIGPETKVEVTEDGVILRRGSDERELEIAERVIGGRPLWEVRDGASGERLGWVASGRGQGYADVIELLVGLDATGRRLTGLYVLSQKETPALGDAITSLDFRSRFVGAPTNRQVEVTRDEIGAAEDPSRVLAITAATVSSRSVCEIVNRTVADIREALDEERDP
jgi:electron transport complex protein RnfG